MKKNCPIKRITPKQAVCTALFLMEIATTAQTLYFVSSLGLSGMSIGAVISSTISLLCLILGVFLFAGATAVKGNNSCFLAMAFLLHILMSCDCAGWYLEGHPAFNANQERIMNLMFVLDIFLVPVCLLMIRQLTGKGETMKELLQIRNRFDGLETAVAAAGILLLFVLWIRNFSTGILFTVSAEGRFVYGPFYMTYFLIALIGELFGLLRLIRAKRPFRQALLFFLIVALAAAGCVLDRYGVAVDIAYALTFLLLFRIFSEFFSELRFANRRYSGVLETYVSGSRKENTEEETGAGKEYRATVLLSDLRGFTAQSAQMATKEIVEVLNRYMAAMMGIIRENGGSVTEFLGDGLLCVFGAPDRSEDHADRALKAAVQMQQAMEEVNGWNEAQGYPALHMGIGVATGNFTYGNIGTMRVARPMAVGGPVNDVFKAEMYALGGQIVVTKEAKDALKAEPLVRQEIRHVREGSETITLYQVLGFKGDSKLALTEKEEPLFEPEKPIRIRVRRVDGKHIDEKPAEGLLYAISPQKAVLRLPEKPEPLHYICFTAEEIPEGAFYARIPMDITGNTVKVDLTGLPEGAESRYRTFTGK